MEPTSQQQTPTPDEIVADFAIGIEVSDLDLSRAFHAAAGTAHRRLEREVLRRCERAIAYLASKDADVAEEVRAALQLEVLSRHPRSLASSGGIESYGGWVRKIVGKNAPAHAAHARLDYAVGLNRALRIEMLSREYLDIRSTDELRARMAADGVEALPSVDDVGYAMQLQARRRAATLTPPKGADEGWTEALVGSSTSVTSVGVGAPGAESEEDEGAARALLLKMGFNGDEATVLVCEHGLDGAAPVTGQREIAEATGINYGRVRSVRVTLQRKIARLDVGAVREMLTLAEPGAPRATEQRRDVAAEALAAAVAVDVVVVDEGSSPDIQAVAGLDDSVQGFTANPQTTAQIEPVFAAGYGVNETDGEGLPPRTNGSTGPELGATIMTNAIDLRPLIIRDRARRRAASWVATQTGVPEHQVIATHAAIESWSYTDLDCDEYDETFADWASTRTVREVFAEAPERLGIDAGQAARFSVTLHEFRQGVRRRREGYAWYDEWDPERRLRAQEARRGARRVIRPRM